MVSRYGGGRKEPTVHCFLSHCAPQQPPPPPPQHQHPPPPMSQFRIISANTGRPDVGFHVAPGGFAGQQQGGGPNGPPGGPQGMPRGIHHPGHHGGPPGTGNPSLPPQGSSGGPGQGGGPNQQQANQGPQGPTPTSTPPGPDMGKQPPQHLQQGQPPQQMPPGGQLQLYNVGVPNQARPAGSQSYYQGPRVPNPRMANHRGQMVNMQTNHVGQQMFSHQVQMQVPQMYPGQVVPAQLQQQMFVAQGHMPLYQGQPRHQNHSNAAAYYAQAGHQPILMTHQQIYAAAAGYPQTHAPTQAPYYYQTASPVGMPRQGAGVPGGPGPQMSQPQPQQVVPGGPAAQQMGQPTVPMALVSGPPVAVGSQSAGAQGPPASSRNSSGVRRKFALDIVDPKTMKSINSEIYVEGSSAANSPPGSENSSARQTPQPPPNTDASAMDVVADFAARVAKVASEDSISPAPQPFSEGSSLSPANEQIASPNEPVISIQDQTEFDNSKPIVGVEDNNQWKTPLPKNTSSKSELVKDTETVPKLDSAENNNVKTVSDVEHTFPKEFVPQSVGLSYKEVVKSVDAPREAISEQPIQVIINKEPQPILENNSTPVVSANANTPSITLVHKTKTEGFSALKSNNQVNQSPRKKLAQKESTPVESKTSREVSVEKSVAQSVQIVPSLAVLTTQSAKPEVPKKDEFVVPHAPPSKDKRDTSKKDKASRGRREKASESRERGDKNRSSTDRKLSQSRDRETGGARKNSSKSRERETDKSQQREKTPQPQAEKIVVKREVEVVVAPTSVLEPTPPPVKTVVAPQYLGQLSDASDDAKHPNGDVSPDTADGKVLKPHQQNVKGAKRGGKMRSEQSRKLSDKEAPDAIESAATEPAAASPAEVIPAAESPVSESAPPPQVSAEALSSIVKDEAVEAEKMEQEESEKMVLALNEENAKVSAAALQEDNQAATEDAAEDSVKVPPPLVKQLSYKPDQWSPLNTDGKKKYDRDFLMELKEDPQSKKKPENLPDMDVVLKDNTNRQQSRGMAEQRVLVNRSSENNFSPGFMRGGGGGGASNSRGPLPKRNSQQGNKPVSKSGKPNVIHMSLSLREDVKLHETENAWKPGVMKKEVTQEEIEVDDLYKSVRGVLNKLTPQKFDTLVSQVKALPIDNCDKLTGVINLVFEKAVDEPGFSVAYALMCKVLSDMKVPAERKTPEDPEYVNFRKLIVNRCQTEFEKNTEAELNKDAKFKEINLQTDPEKKKELMLIFEEEERRIRMKSVGNIRFIGELFKLKMLTAGIMHRCIGQLLTAGDEESLECLCKLLTTIGKDLESKAGPSANANNDLTAYFTKMREIASKRGPGSVSSRVRFMLQDVIELRQGKWVPRRDDANPKTMDQIQKEAEKETLDMHIALNSNQTPGRRNDDRGGNAGDRDRRGGNKNQRGDNNDGWTNVASRGAPRHLVVDTSKIKVNKTEMEITLGNTNLFSKWSRGAGGSSKSEEKKSAGQGYNNLFSVLGSESTGDDKRAPPPPMLSQQQRLGPTGKFTPSASIEKERMLASFKTPSTPEVRSSRSTGPRQSSRPSSRDNSSRRSGLGSQPGSVSASNEDVSRVQPERLAAPSKLATELSIEEVQKKSKLVVDELLHNNLILDCCETVQETFIDSQMHEFVRESINVVLEKTAHCRQNVSQLMCTLMRTNVITSKQYMRGMEEVLEVADDIAIDVPKVWVYLAESIVPIMSSELVSFAEFHSLVRPPVKASQLVAEVLKLLIKDKGPNWIRTQWTAVGLQLQDFLEEGLVDSFVKVHNLESMVGAQPTSTDSQLTMDEMHKKLTTFLNTEPLPTSFDPVCDWIEANVNERVKEPQFIRALMTVICEKSIKQTNTTWKLEEKTFHNFERLIAKYVDNNEELELQCIYAVQALMNSLEHPQGLLCNIFQYLYDNGIFSNDSFISWEESTDPAEQAGKGVAMKSVTSFYTALKETVSSCDES